MPNLKRLVVECHYFEVRREERSKDDKKAG
jgi:hypothetical protein